MSVPEWRHDPRDRFRQAKQATARLFISLRPLSPSPRHGPAWGRAGRPEGTGVRAGAQGGPKMSEVRHGFIPLPSQKSTVLGSGVPSGITKGTWGTPFLFFLPCGQCPHSARASHPGSLSCARTARNNACRGRAPFPADVGSGKMYMTVKPQLTLTQHLRGANKQPHLHDHPWGERQRPPQRPSPRTPCAWHRERRG